MSEEAGSAALLARAVTSAREESRQAAIRLDAIGAFVEHAIRADGGTTDDWLVDAVAAATIDLAAALRISRGLADWQVRYAYDMRHRLPLLAARFRAGDITEDALRTAAFRTGLILDDDVLARVDATLAERMPRWGVAGRSDVHNRIDKIVAGHDADAVRRRAKRRVERGVTYQDIGDGLCEIVVVTDAIDGAATTKRLTALAHSVCDKDPRTLAERRAAAHAAAINGQQRLSCRCGRSDCPAGGIIVGPVVIHVVTDQASLDPAPTTAQCRSPIGAVVPGVDGLFPAEMLAEIAPEARQRTITHPGDAPPESGYRPSAALAEFVRARDLTCRFPNCDVSAWECDIDHVTPYGDGGPTQASSLSCKCRTHHLAKTFWGWHDEQLPDGTIIWTSPSGWVSVTRPAGAALYPALAVPTAPASPPPADSRREHAAKGTKMPRRQRSRARQRTATIVAQRRANHIARTTPARLHHDDEDYTYDETFLEDQRPIPPPF